MSNATTRLTLRLRYLPDRESDKRIGVEGSLRQDTYEKDGEERRSVSVIARRVEYL